MRPFTEEEYKVMITELTDPEHPSFDMLCTIAEKTLRSQIRGWCSADPDLRGMGLEEDILQEVFIRLIRTAVNGFLIRADRGGAINEDPDEFRNWMCEVARNIKRDTASSIRRRKHRFDEFDDGDADQYPDESTVTDEALAYKRERLQTAFRIALDSDKEVYILLTWLAQNLIVLRYNIDKIGAIRLMVDVLSDKTLFELKRIVFVLAQQVRWIRIEPAQADRIACALRTDYNGMPIGQYKYKDFYMKKGGKASISDWIFRMNQLIERLA